VGYINQLTTYSNPSCHFDVIIRYQDIAQHSKRMCLIASHDIIRPPCSFSPPLTWDMENASGTPSSSRLPSTSHPPSGSSRAPSCKSVEGGAYELNALSSQALVSEPEKRTWFSRAVLRFARQRPSLYNQCRKVILYIRGPRPKVDLPRA